MAYYEYPHTRNYDQDLGYIIEQLQALQKAVENLQTRVEALEKKETE